MSTSIKKNIIFKFLLNLFNIIIPIIIGPYVYRVLGAELNGNISFADSIYQYFFIFASFGIYQYGLREISRVRDDKEKLQQTFTSLFTITLVTNIISTIGYLIFVTTRYSGQAVYSACLITTFNLVSNTFYTEWVNEAMENYDFITIKTIIVRAIYTILLLVMVKSADNYIQYLILLVAANFFNNFLSFIYVKRKIKFNFHGLTIVRHIKPMLLVVILSNSNVLYTQLDKFMLGEVKGMTEVSFYTLSQKVMTIISTLMLTVIHVTIPRLSNYLAKDDDDKYMVLLDKITNLYFIFVYPAAIGMFLLANEIVSLYGGAEFINTGSVLMAFSIYMISLSYEGILSNQVMYIKGKEKQQVAFTFIAGIVNLILNLLLVAGGVFNPTTAIITTTIANTLFVIIQYIYVRVKLKVNINLFSFSKLKYLFISLLFIPVTMFLKGAISNQIIFVGAVVLVNAIIYFGIILLVDRETLRFIK